MSHLVDDLLEVSRITTGSFQLRREPIAVARIVERAVEGGLGIGLSLVERLVDLHGVTVEASSVPEEGSEFVVRLPTVPAPEERGGSPSGTAAESDPGGLRVLVVDDNVDAAQSLAMLLRAGRHDVRVAHDGPSALEAAREYHPEVVLLDIGLPGFDGFEVARRLRRDRELSRVVVVAMTGYGQEADRQHSQEAGFDHHLVKPAEFESVRRILASVPARSRPPASSPEA